MFHSPLERERDQWEVTSAARSHVIGLISGHWLVGNVLPTVGVLRLDRTHRETAEQSLESRHVLLNRLAAGLLTEAAVTGVAAGLKEDDRSLGVFNSICPISADGRGAVGKNQTSRQQA